MNKNLLIRISHFQNVLQKELDALYAASGGEGDAWCPTASQLRMEQAILMAQTALDNLELVCTEVK